VSGPGNHQSAPIGGIAFPAYVTSSLEAGEHATHRLLLHPVGGSQLTLGQGARLQRMQGQQSCMSQIVGSQPVVPVVLDEPGGCGQQPAQRPVGQTGCGDVLIMVGSMIMNIASLDHRRHQTLLAHQSGRS
jgi:hypothetical protein